MEFKYKKGFTFVEGLMVIVIIAILAASGAVLLISFVQNEVFVPSQLKSGMVAAEALEIMIEGDNQAKGLRTSRIVTNIQDYQVTFINQDNQTVRFRLDTGSNKLYRSINGGQETLIPYYVAPAMNMLVQNNRLFTYFDAAEIITTDPANVRRIEVTLIARTGSGSYTDWEGQTELTSAVAVKKFQ